MEDRREITEHFVRAEARQALCIAQQALVEGGRVTPTFLVVCRRHVQSGAPNDTTACVVPILMRRPMCQQTMDQFFSYARAAALAGDAIAAVLLVERWFVLDRPVTAEETIAAPDRVETLTCSIEWADGRPPDQHVLRWVQDQGFTDFDDVAGRIVGLDLVHGNEVFPTPRDKPVPADVMEAARYIAVEAVCEYHQRVGESLQRKYGQPVQS